MMIRGALNKRLANGLRFTTKQNRRLTDHYYNYPESPDGFGQWQKTLHDILDESNTRLSRYQN